MKDAVEQSYRHCAQVTRRCAASFYSGLRLLPAEKRRALYAVYAFLRACDDSVDDAPESQRAEQIRRWRTLFSACLEGDCSGDPCLPALNDSIRRYRIPPQYFHLLLDGTEMDLAVCRYPDFAALYEYCFRVASTVGLICLRVWGFAGATAERDAERLGIAFQLTNILRDIREDAERGRIYLPGEDLERFGYSEDDIYRGVRNPPFQALMAFEVNRARSFYRSADALLPCVSPDSRPCLAAMATSYETLLDEIERRGFDVYSQRVSLPPARKLAIAARAWWRYHIRREEAPSPR